MLNYIHATAKIGEKSVVGNFSSIEEDCIIGARVIIHNNVTIYAGTVIGDDTEIFDGAVIGRPPKSSGNTVHKLAESYTPVRIGKGCIIGANSVIYAQCTLKDRVLVGDGVKLREGAMIGEGALIAMNCTFNHDVIMGSRSRTMDLTHITANTFIEDDVFVGVGVVTVNDNTMRSPGADIKEVGRQMQIRICEGSRIGSGALILPNIKIGKGAKIGAYAMVTHNISDQERIIDLDHARLLEKPEKR